MAICQSCGGVLGRDCFNPVDCAVISAQLAQEANHPRAQHPLVAERDQLRQQVEGLLSAINKHRNESSPTSTPQKFSLDGELYEAADQVRKELGKG